MQNYLSWCSTISHRIHAANLDWPEDHLHTRAPHSTVIVGAHQSVVRDKVKVETLSFREYFDYLWRQRFYYKRKNTQQKVPNLKRFPPIPRAHPNQYWQHHMGPIVWKWCHATAPIVPTTEAITFLKFICELIECHVCKTHFHQVVVHFENNNSLQFDSVFLLSVFIHNLVNFRLGKEIVVDINKLTKEYTSF